MSQDQIYDCIIVYSSKKHFPFIEHILLHTKRVLENKGYKPLLLRDFIISNALTRKAIVELVDKATFGVVILDGMRSNVTFELGLLMGQKKCVIVLKSREAEINIKTLFVQYDNNKEKDSNLAPKEFDKLKNPALEISKHFSDSNMFM